MRSTDKEGGEESESKERNSQDLGKSAGSKSWSPSKSSPKKANDSQVSPPVSDTVLSPEDTQTQVFILVLYIILIYIFNWYFIY